MISFFADKIEFCMLFSEVFENDKNKSTIKKKSHTEETTEFANIKNESGDSFIRFKTLTTNGAD